jgi:hypothetical protein
MIIKSSLSHLVFFGVPFLKRFYSAFPTQWNFPCCQYRFPSWMIDTLRRAGLASGLGASLHGRFTSTISPGDVP